MELFYFILYIPLFLLVFYILYQRINSLEDYSKMTRFLVLMILLLIIITIFIFGFYLFVFFILWFCTIIKRVRGEGYEK